MWIDLPHPAVIAHRGDKKNAPENTLAAFKLAAEKGADAIELDVQLSADGKVIVFHDPVVDRTTNGTGRVSTFSLDALRTLDAGSWFSEQFHGEKVPTLGEVFETVGKSLYLNIELKNYATPNDNLVAKVVESVKRHGMQDRTLFSSFLPHNLRKARLLLPEVPRGLLTIRGTWGRWGRAFGWRGDYFALHPNIIDVHSGLIERVHAKGKRANVWTVTTEDEMKRMVGLGVDAIITSDLEMVLHFLGRDKLDF
jgi:glycerophosphoryl diester phosphodiesterase